MFNFKKNTLLTISFLFFTQSVLADSEIDWANRPGVEGKREVTAKYHWVGKLRNMNEVHTSCAVWIYRHGIAITAKHCIGVMPGDAVSAGDEAEYNSSSDNLLKNNFLDKKYLEFDLSENEKITISKDASEMSVHLDTGDNDLAYILYDPIVTKGKIDLAHVDIKLEKMNEGQELSLIGFPQPQPSGRVDRVISTECRATGSSGRVTQTEKRTGYIGILEDTTCSGWWGVSGGPVFTEAEDGKITIYGLVTHTFDENEYGMIDVHTLKEDSLGTSAAINMSSLSLNEDLGSVIKDINSKY